MTEPSTEHDSPELHIHQFRSGTAARLAGLPATTLRVWERRYGVVAQKSANGRRVYTQRDVSRLRLLRQLTGAGHAIGTIAKLELDALRELVAGGQAATARAGGNSLEAVVVGRTVARALEAVPGCEIKAVFDDLEQVVAASRTAHGSVGLLLVRVPSLQPLAVERILALGASFGARAIHVVYGFGTSACVRSLRDAGASVRREPLTDAELEQWVRRDDEVPATRDKAWVVAPRQFSDEALARLASMPSPVACECLRHLSEIVAQLGAFERYSRDCLSSGPADAALHRQLSQTAGAARTMFERALRDVVVNDGLELPDEPALR